MVLSVGHDSTSLSIFGVSLELKHGFLGRSFPSFCPAVSCLKMDRTSSSSTLPLGTSNALPVALTHTQKDFDGTDMVLEGQINKDKPSAGDTQDDNNRLNDEIRALRSELELAQAAILRESSRKVHVESQLEACRSRKDTLLKDKEALKEHLKRVRDEFRAFRTYSASENSQKMEAVRSMFQESLFDAQRTVHNLNSSKSRLILANRQRVEEEQNLRSTIEDLQKETEALTTERTVLQNQGQELRKELARVHLEAKSQKEEYERIQKQLRQSIAKIRSLTDDNHNLRNMSDECQVKLKDSQSTIHKLDERGTYLRKTIFTLKEKNAAFEQELSKAAEIQSKTTSDLESYRAWYQYHTGKTMELESQLEKAKQEQKDLRSEFQAVEDRSEKDAVSMRNRLGLLSRQLSKAQRQIKSFDQLSSFQHEIRLGHDYESIRRCKNYTPSSRGTQVITMVQQLNTAIQQFAKHFAPEENDHFFKTQTAKPDKRSKALLGEDVSAILQHYSEKREYSNVRLLLQVVLRMFLVAWCFGIIEGWYPKRQNFLDLLAKLNDAQAGESHPSIMRYLLSDAHS